MIFNPKKKTWGREDRVQAVLDALEKEHGNKFTVMQYRIWSEMVAGGMHGSTAGPPATSMFVRAGSKKTISNVTDNAMASGNKVLADSPAKIIANCYKQLGELG